MMTQTETDVSSPEIVLETPRLLLRTMRAGDLEALLVTFGDPKVAAAFQMPPFNHHQMEQWLQRNLDHQARHGFGLFSVIHRESGRLIGDCGLELMDVQGAHVAELGYDLRSDYWNRGYATEAAAAVRDYAFTQLGLNRLISLIRVGNLASRRVAEKIGMHLVAEITHHDRTYWQLAVTRPLPGDADKHQPQREELNP